MMSDQQSPASDRQAGAYRLTRTIDERRTSSMATREEIARLAATLKAAQSVLATGRVPGPAPAAAASVPLLPRRLRLRAVADSRRRRRLAAGLRRTPALPMRGAMLPCSRTGCHGIMTYNGERVSAGVALLDRQAQEVEGGWVCDARHQHAHAPDRHTARQRWEDDGGTRT